MLVVCTMRGRTRTERISRAITRGESYIVDISKDATVEDQLLAAIVLTPLLAPKDWLLTTS